MDDKPRLFDLKDQPVIIQLTFSIITVIIAGTILFYLLLFAGLLIFQTGISEILSIPSEDGGPREVSILKYLQVAQHIGLFFIPAILISLFLRNGEESFLRTNKVPEAVQVLLVILLAFLILPVTGYTGILNSKMNLPEWLSGVEGWMKTKEDAASHLTGLLIKSSQPGGLVINIFILAVVPAIAEEMIFRGIIQQLLCRLFRSGHVGIWITAIFFSAIHLQFFGFLPRLVLGLSFGYLFFWSRNLWLPVIAHFINNCIPVLMSFFADWNELTDKASALAERQIILPLFAALLCGGVFYYFRTEYKKNLIENN